MIYESMSSEEGKQIKDTYCPDEYQELSSYFDTAIPWVF